MPRSVIPAVLIVTLLLMGCVQDQASPAPIPTRSSTYLGVPLVDRLPSADDFGSDQWSLVVLEPDAALLPVDISETVCQGSVRTLLDDSVARRVAAAQFDGPGQEDGDLDRVTLRAEILTDVDLDLFTSISNELLSCIRAPGVSPDRDRPFISFEPRPGVLPGQSIGFSVTLSNFATSRTRHLVIARGTDETLLTLCTSWSNSAASVAGIDMTTAIERFLGPTTPR